MAVNTLRKWQCLALIELVTVNAIPGIPAAVAIPKLLNTFSATGIN